MGPSALPPLTDFWHDLDPCEFSVSYKSWHQQLWNDGNLWIFICASPVLCAVGSRTTSWMSPSLRDCVVRVEGDRRPNRTGLSRKNMRSKGGSWSLITTAAWSSFSNAYGQSLSHMWLPGRQASRSFTISQSWLKLMSTESVMPFNHLILCHLLLLLPSIFPSIRVFPNESVLHNSSWPKYWSFSFSISSSNEYWGFISCRIDWFDLLAVQRTLKCLLQHPSCKAPVFPCLAFLTIQPSHPYITTGNTIALTIQDLCRQSNVSAF